MLDADTRRRIDTARDILVGKVPDPKSQVEQITIALIYKFMDDLDAESEELGGERKFFAGEFARYGWAKLTGLGVGGYDALNLYAEAITRMPENPGIPPLFRDIFNNAYLPYRDPETLRAFLKIIDEFTYDHSERLGDAFEYLLSVLGAQGDAGQFRTPRHIIDFIVAVLDPKKDETVLDPACGTAGFLISAYKHILAANTDGDGRSTLTPDDRGRMVNNFEGYDISPDMVRLSLVNMYLHGFREPRIYEYDTLTSDDRWNDYADVILANPPFMSPKGGIRPHNRFAVQSKRSEVLFVDYMAEHLSANGRAGIIVPEGIIFQSQTTHRQLRKMLVEDCLVAVVSLPAGVFKPYSGVKTSILILDKALTKMAGSIAFFKAENDGFDLGDQRRPVDTNDLPRVQKELDEYLGRLRAGENVDTFQPTMGQVIEKGKIRADLDYNLSGEHYRERESHVAQWPMISMGDIVDVLDSFRRPITKHDRKPGPYPYYGATGILDYVEGYLFDEPLVLVGEDGAKWGPGESSSFGVEGKVWVNNHAHVLRPQREHLMDTFLIEVLNQMDLTHYITGVTVPKLNQARLKNIEIPLPPLEVQRGIVAEIEGCQKVIDGARAVVENYRPHIAIDPEWPLVPIKAVATVESGFGFPLAFQGKTDEHIPFLKVSDMNLPGNEMNIVTWNNSISYAALRELKAKSFPRGTVIFPKIGAAIATNKKRILTRDSTYDNNVMGIVPNTAKLLPHFLYSWLMGFDLSRWASASQPPSMRKTVVEQQAIPLPPVAVQQSILEDIEAEQTIVEANRELIDRFKRKIQSAVERVWGNEITTALEA